MNRLTEQGPCDCLTEPNPLDRDGPEVVLIHSARCHLHPEAEAPEQ